jgi:hypothetical protein
MSRRPAGKPWWMLRLIGERWSDQTSGTVAEETGYIPGNVLNNMS